MIFSINLPPNILKKRLAKATQKQPLQEIYWRSLWVADAFRQSLKQQKYFNKKQESDLLCLKYH